MQRAHPLLADGAAGVEVAREVVVEPLGEVGHVRVAVAEAGVRDVDGRRARAVGLRPVLEALLDVGVCVASDQAEQRVRDVQAAVAADGEQQPAVDAGCVGSMSPS